jgi:glycosyltransferase involved in cell wall biosynthesis
VDILYLSPADWSGPKGRFQHVAERLAKNNRVMYADGLGVRPIGRRDWRRSSSKILRWFRPSAARIALDGALQRITPLAIPTQSVPAIRSINRSLLYRYVSRHLMSNNYHDILVWIAYPHPDLVAILDRLGPRAVVYDCVDEWSGFERAYGNLAAWEETLARRADLVFTTAEPLRMKLSRWNPRCFLVPNGVDLETFAHAGRRVPRDVAGIRSPRVGFVGNIDQRVDLGLIREVARVRKDWQLVFVGDYLATSPRPSADNIHWLGFRPYDQVADYMASFDVCIIPFYVDELTSAVDPLKLYQYLAAGKPVVSTPLPRSLDFSGVVSIARGGAEFVAAIEEMLQCDDLRDRRIAAVRPHSWAERVKTMVDLARRHLAVELQR